MVKNPLPMSETQGTWVRHLGWEDSLKEQMAAHPRTVAWLIPWIEEPSWLQFWGRKELNAIARTYASPCRQCGSSVMA